MLNPVTVLLTSVGCPGGPSIIESLRIVKERRIRIIGTDMRRLASGLFLCDKSYVISPASSAEYLEEIVNIVKRQKPDVIVPLTDPESLVLAQNRHKLEAMNCRVAVSKVETVRIATDKGETYTFLDSKGVAVPAFGLPRSWAEFRDCLDRLEYPRKTVCIKPTGSAGTRGFYIIPGRTDDIDIMSHKPGEFPVVSLDELERRFRENFPPLVVMEYLGGQEYSVDSLTKNGRALVVVPRTRMRIKAGITDSGMVEKNADIEKLVRAAVKNLRTDFSVNIQVRLSSNGVPKITEVNPRLSGTVVLCTMAGVNLPYLTVKMALGEKARVPRPRYGTVIVRYLEGISMVKKRGQLTEFNWRGSY